MKDIKLAIEIHGLKKRYSSNDADTLKGIDLEIKQGDFYGILGPNSAGKTTLISIICGLLKFQAGKVIIDGIELKSISDKVKSAIGLVPQEIALYPSLTVYENIEYFGQMHGIYGDQLKERVEHLLYQLQLLQHAKKRISRCSGGIKRRTNLAAGMIHSPKILILDEPTVGVDAQSRNLIFEYLKELNNSGTTILYTTHYISEAEELCSQVSIIDDGSIVETGSPKSLISKHENCNDLGDVYLKLTGKALRE